MRDFQSSLVRTCTTAVAALSQGQVRGKRGTVSGRALHGHGPAEAPVRKGWKPEPLGHGLGVEPSAVVPDLDQRMAAVPRSDGARWSPRWRPRAVPRSTAPPRLALPLLPPKRPKPKGGHPRMPDQQAMTAIFYVLRTSVPAAVIPCRARIGVQRTRPRRRTPLPASAPSAARPRG